MQEAGESASKRDKTLQSEGSNHGTEPMADQDLRDLAVPFEMSAGTSACQVASSRLPAGSLTARSMTFTFYHSEEPLFE